MSATSGQTAGSGPVLGGLGALLRGSTGDTAWALLDQGAALLTSMASFLLLGRTLGVNGYGAFVGLYALMGPFLALSQSGVYLASMEHVVREGEDPATVARSCISLTALNAALWVPVLSLAGVHWIEGLDATTAFLLVGAEFLLNGLLSASVGMVQALDGFPAAARLRIAGAASKLGLLVLLAWAGSLTLASLAVGQLFTLGVVALLALGSVSRLVGVPVRPGRIQRPHVRSSLLYGVAVGASIAQGDGDKFVLNAAHHQADAGRYGAAYRLVQIVLLPVNALIGATHLSFLDGDDGSWVQLRRAARLSLVSLAYAVPAAACLALIAPLVPRVLGRGFAESTFILQLLAPVVILRSIGAFPMNGLMGLGRNGLRAKLLLGNAAVALGLYAALIPGWSWRGALVATLLSETLLTATGWVVLVACERRRAFTARGGRA